MEHNYDVDLSWTKDRTGILYSTQLFDELEVATPPPFPKGVENIWSPEHLFTAAVNSCLMTTFLAIAEKSRLEFTSFKTHSSGKLEMVDGKYLMTEVILKPSLTITNEADREKALRTLEKAESVCLISNSIKSKITMEPEITVQA
jgi:peroxiredoxin-like protein